MDNTEAKEATAEATVEVATPEVAAEVTPEVASEVTAEATPEIASEVAAEVTAEVTPEVASEAAAPSVTAADKTKQSRKFLLTINNPEEKGLTHEVLEKKLQAISALNYYCMADEIGAEEHTPHTHIFCHFNNPKRFSVIKNAFPEAHIDACQGSNSQNRNYVFKEGKWKDSEKGTTNILTTHVEFGELPGDEKISWKESEMLDQIEAFLDQGLTPNEITSKHIAYEKYAAIIKKSYYRRRANVTPVINPVKVYYHFGDSGTGKSYSYAQLCTNLGEEQVYFLSDYANNGTAGFDGYNGEPVLFMDEFKGDIPFSLFLVITDCYKADIHARYSNVTKLWNEIHISTILSPEELYSKMVERQHQGTDCIQQLKRRINYIVFHWKEGDQFCQETVPMKDYESDYRHKGFEDNWFKNQLGEDTPFQK